MDNNTVHIEKCVGYNLENILYAVEKIFDTAGGGMSLLRNKNKVVVKPNLLMAKQPEFAITTHPVVVEAVIRYMLRYIPPGCITIAESPGGTYTESVMRRVYDICGMKKVAESTGVRLNYDCTSRGVAYKPGGGSRIGRTFEIITPVADSDFIVDVCKLKTHGLTTMSGAVKNLFGCVPGLDKPRYHSIYPDIRDFSDMIIDLCDLLKPGISVIDGIVGMEGNGPSGGSPRNFGVIMGSANPFAADLAAAAVMGFANSDVPIVDLSVKRGFCPSNISGLTFTGLKPEAVKISDIAAPDTTKSSLAGLTRLGRVYQKLVNVRPDAGDKCTKCGICVKVCPKNLISVKGSKWKLNSKRECIQCFCCQEMCPVHAIETKRSWIGKILK